MAAAAPEASSSNDIGLALPAKLVTEQIREDSKFPSISDLLYASSSSEYRLPIPHDLSIIELQRSIPLPDALFDQYDLLQCRCFMGFFPEIKRAWITVDHRLFLWNYTEDNDFYSFEDQEQVIVSVALAKPKPGVFLEEIQYVMVIATPLEVLLLGVSIESNLTKAAGDITLYATHMSVSADNVAMTTMVGTKAGRIFMAGNDGHLYEFLYQAEDGWLSKRCRKINLTQTAVSYFIPTYFSRVHDDPTISMVVDDDRNILYLLTQKSSIEVIYLGPKGADFHRVFRHNNIANAASMICPSFTEGISGEFRIVSIHTIPESESRTLHLVGITSGGARLYFSVIKRNVRYFDNMVPLSRLSTPETLELVHVRLPDPRKLQQETRRDQQQPQQLQQQQQQQQPQGQTPLAFSTQITTSREDNKLSQTRSLSLTYHIHAGYYHNGMTLLANSQSDEYDMIVGAALDCGYTLKQLSSMTRATLTELSSSVIVDGKTWAISEIDPQVSAGLNDLDTISCRSTRTFAVLTNSGINILAKRRPVDVLLAILSQLPSKEADLREFMAIYGQAQTCAMCLTILGADIFDQRVLNVQAVTAAATVLFEYSGAPSIAEGSQFNVGATGPPVPTVVHSGRHDGLVLYLSRVLKPIWTKAPFALQKEGLDSPLLKVAFSVASLTDIQSLLIRLRKFIDDNPRFIPGQLDFVIKSFNPLQDDRQHQHQQSPSQQPQPPQQQPQPQQQQQASSEAWQAEADSLGRLYNLILQCTEAISFICLLSDFNITKASASLSEKDRTRASGLTFEQIVCSEEGRSICKSLIISIINMQMKQHINVDNVSDILGQRCASFFSDTDVTFYKGFECLKQARESDEIADTQALLKESLRLFKSICGSLSIEQVDDIVQDYIDLKFEDGAMSLALLAAEQCDPGNLAVAYWRDGMQESDARKQVYNKRVACYRCAFGILDQFGFDKPEATKAQKLFLNCLKSQDQLFHFMLYDWLLERGKGHHLFQIESPYVQEFLMLEPHTKEKWNILWRYYVHINDYLDAALVQRNLADMKGSGDTLEARLEYLSLAISNVRSAIHFQSNTQSQQLLKDLEDKLEVGLIQMDIYNMVKQSGNHELLKKLDDQLFDVSDLYHKFAEPLSLPKAMLLIFKASNHDDPEAVRSIWEAVADRALGEDESSHLFPLSARIAELGARLYPSEVVFPLDFICQLLLTFIIEYYSEYQPGLITQTILQTKTPHRALFATLDKMFDESYSRKDTQTVGIVVSEIITLLESWLSSMGGATVADPSYDSNAFPVVIVDDAISKYITATNVLSTQGAMFTSADNASVAPLPSLVQDLQAVQFQLRRAF
ncbi:hypothetical protein EV182_000049 [Spiromyces aspiralis]|uniref:Uncharacterized protein n=1 Tax=Spiromyces aspiralis TaxID=68401 RepID=A0ACC1HI57_9FUNG|nr:hypothetical protein EV182_000049 [Spiromyces aspiralis]